MTSLATSSTSSTEVVKKQRTLKDSKALLRLEEAAGGRDGLARTLSFLPMPTEAESRLLALLELDAGDVPLAQLLREAKLSPGALASAVAAAKGEFEREVAMASARDAAPDVVDRLTYHAMPQVRRCPRLCQKDPAGGLKTIVMLGTESVECPQCEGAGAYPQESEHMTWAADTLLKIANLPEAKTGPLVAIQQNTIVKGGGTGLIEGLLQVVHEASMIRDLPAEPITDAEIVLPQNR